MAKKKRTFTSIEVVERQFRRRMARGIHIGVFMASQAAIWLWWIAEAARSGNGFRANFFADRLIVLVVWAMLLLTHIWVTRLLNERDRQIGEMLEGGFTGSQDDDDFEVKAQPRPVVYARRLEENFGDDDLSDEQPEAPSRNSNHR